MTDKALEAALLPCPLCSSEMKQEQWYDRVGSPLPTLHVSHAKSTCPLAGVQFDSTADNIAAWNRRAPLSALPGEAEVVGLVEKMRRGTPEKQVGIGRHGDRIFDVDLAATDALLLKAADALQAMQARAEKAERERDALREALKPSGETKAEYIGEFTIAVERHVNSDEEVDDEGEGAMDPYEHVTVPWTTIKEIMAAISERAARTALTGGSNG